MSLLSELCSICYEQKPKYRCPRCKTGTCSLPCYKRHQQRASCSGQRDPAEYLKRSQLATPEGIDRDYNYLKGVERGIDNAHRDTYDRGISSTRVTKSFSRGMHPDSKLQHYLNQNRITMGRAPTGMSRQKTNKTRNTKSDRMMWTVEWVDSEGHVELQDDCLDSVTIEETYSELHNRKKHAEWCRLNPEKVSEKKAVRAQKRKREEEQGEQQDGGAAVRSQDVEAPDPGTAVEATARPTGSDSTEVATTADVMSQQKQEDKPKPDRFFYLLKTGTISANKVLIPLMPNCTLTESLQDQMVMEYPTYYVLPYSPGKLPPGFLTEHQYLKIRKGEEEELDEAIVKAEGGGALNAKAKIKSEPGASSSAPVDANKILDMLKRDVTR